MKLPRLGPTVHAFLEKVVRLQLVGVHAVKEFLRANSTRLPEWTTPQALGEAFVAAGLLTTYQLNRVTSGTTHGLVLGNYRVIDRLGSGSVGVVFLGEHVVLKRRAAIKVLPVDEHMPSSILDRFYAEMRVLADLHHPHIVTAFDAGFLPSPARGEPTLHYLVMELVDGGDLEQYVYDHGVVPIPLACEWMRQAASGLQEAHNNHLIHRDLKPSNLLRTVPRGMADGDKPGPASIREPGQVKLVDFGLARQFCSTLTDPRMLLGSIEFMAPEQSIDPSAVGPPADIYGLAATFFWMVTGQTPFVIEQNLASVLKALQHDRPRRLSQFLPDVPPELDAFVDRMLERDPNKRPQLPVAVMNELSRFAADVTPPWEVDLRLASPAGTRLPTPAPEPDGSDGDVLLVEDDPSLSDQLLVHLRAAGCVCEVVRDGRTALSLAGSRRFDLVVLDLQVPDMDGYALCQLLRERSANPYLKLLLTSGKDGAKELVDALGRGGDDYLPPPFDGHQVAAKVQHLLRLKDAQDRADKLARNLAASNRQLEDSLLARAADVRQAQDALLFAMSKMAESRDGETADHSIRLQHYCLALIEQLKADPELAGILDKTFADNLIRCVPLHDIGKIGLPDSVLLKPGTLDAIERALVETHPVIGAGILETIGKHYGESLSFLGMARAIVRHHHERWDGTGYPDKLDGRAIPLAARIVALADSYDGLRRKRPHKPAVSHAQAAHAILRDSPGKFDPQVVAAFERCHKEFDRIFTTTVP